MLTVRAFRLNFTLRQAVVRSAVGAAVTLAAVAVLAAPSEADKATARQLATEGIKLYRRGKYAEALDRLQRAQALYPAPIHLLYIARCQVKLTKLVEGAETYRQLVKWKLGPQAPKAFKDAQKAGRHELQQLEPRVPALHLEVTPKTAKNLSVVIDGEQLPAAVVGVDRVADPGEHHVRVTAAGYDPAEATVRVQEGETKRVHLELKPSSTPAVAATSRSKAAGSMHVETPAPQPERKPTWYGFMAGLRLGGAFPAGNLRKDAGGNSVPMSDLAGGGGALELHGGVRMWKYFTPVLLFQASSLQGASMSGAKTSRVDAQSYGLGVIVGSRRNHFGGFGELDVLPYERYATTEDVGTASAPCTQTDTLTDAAVRIGGGGVVPISTFLHITPFVMATVAAFSNRTVELKSGSVGCAGPNAPPAGSIPSNQQAVHSLIFVGVGGDYIFGGDRTPK